MRAYGDEFLTASVVEIALRRNKEEEMLLNRLNNLADRGKASNDAWFGCCLPVSASQRLWLVAVLVLLVVPLALGVQRWERFYIAPIEQDDFLRAIQQTSDGGYIAGGSISPPGPVVWLVKLDSLGDTMWTRTYDPAGGQGAGIQALIVARDGGFVMTGGAYPGAFLMKTDSMGDSLWARRMPAPNSWDADLKEMSGGGFVTAADWWDGQSTDACVIRTDSLGDTLWARTFGRIGGLLEGSGIVETKDRGVVFAGTWDGDSLYKAWLFRLDSLGTVVWDKKLSGPADFLFTSVCRAPDGGFVAGGSICLGPGFAYLVRVDSLGDTMWTRRYSSPLGVGCYHVAPSRDGGFVLVCRDMTTNGVSSCLIKTDENGSELWRHDFPGYAYPYAGQQTSDRGYVLAGYGSDSLGSDAGFVIKTDEFGSASVQDPARARGRSDHPIAVQVPTFLAGRLRARCFLPGPGGVVAELFDASGRRLSKLELGYRDVGWHEFDMAVTSSAGTRFLRLGMRDRCAVAKFIVP